MLSVGLANTSVTCSDIELLRVDPVAGTTCGSYMAPYIRQAGGYVVNPDATSNCSFCAMYVLFSNNSSPLQEMMLIY